MKIKIRFKLLLLVAIILMLQSCYRWPSFIIRDGNGYLQYDRSSGKLEFIWENHVQVNDTIRDFIRVDSIQGNDSIR